MAKRKLSGATRSVAVQSRPRMPRKKRSNAGGAGSLYSVHPGIAMVQRWIDELAAKTGRSLDQWLKHIRQDGPKSEKDCREWLKEQYRLGTNSAGWLAEKALG